jgi:hypothetical protein
MFFSELLSMVLRETSAALRFSEVDVPNRSQLTTPPLTPFAVSCSLPDVARVCGNSELWQLMSDASSVIKRDIVFAASLYLQ